MGFRYRKSIKVMPGVRMTVSKSGVSTSVGGRGARVTRTASGRVTKTVGVPGTGISKTSSVSAGKKGQPSAAASSPAKPGMLAPKGERLLYRALKGDQDIAAMESVAQNHPSHALAASTIAGALLFNSSPERSAQLLQWVFDTQSDPADDEFLRKYVSGTIELQIATGVSADLELDRQSIGLMLGELHQARGAHDAAISVVEQLEPTSIAAVSLAELYLDVQRYDEVVDLTDGLSNEDDATALLLVFRGHALRQLGHFTAARETLRDALRSTKRDPAIVQWALAERAYAYLREGKRAQAKKDAEKLMSQDRSHPMLADLLAAIESSG
ncbi:MAG: DUF4236 domain-containing protein [Actinomycetota bacterium]